MMKHIFVSGVLFSAVALEAATDRSARSFWGRDTADDKGRTAISLSAPAMEDWVVNWGDGSTERRNAAVATLTHTYPQAGVYDVSVGIEKNGARASVFPDYGEDVLRSRPLAYFRFSDAANGKTLDSAATISAALSKTAAPLETGISQATGPALRIASGGGVQIADALTQNSDAFSIEFWARPAPGKERQTVFAGKGKKGQNTPYVFFQGNRLFFVLPKAGGVFADLGKRLSDGKWHHYAITYERVYVYPKNNRVRFMCDGELLSATAFDRVDPGAVTYTGALIGTRLDANGKGTDFFTGSLDELAVYDTELLQSHALNRVKLAQTVPPPFRVAVGTPGSEAFTVEQPRITQTVKVMLDPDPQVDNRPALSQAINQAQPGTRLLICDKTTGRPGGTFRIKTVGHKVREWVYIQINDKTDLEIDGGGALLLYEGMAKNFAFSNCTRFAFRNLTMDIDQEKNRVAFWATLTRVDPDEQIISFRTVGGLNKKPEVIPTGVSMWRWRPHSAQTYRICPGPYFNSGSYNGKPWRDESDPTLWHLRLKEKPDHALWKKLADYKAGNNFYLVNNAFFGHTGIAGGGTHITLENLNFHGILGMAVLFDNADYVWVKKCKIGIPDGQTVADRPLSSASDGYHFHCCYGHFLIEDSEITLTDDDPISIKSSLWRNVKRIDDYTLGEHFGEGLKVGGEIEVRDYTMKPCYRGIIVANEGKGRITLDKPLPPQAEKNDYYVNDLRRPTTNWIIRNNYLHDYYGRVMLYTPRGTVEGNRFVSTLFRLGTTFANWETAGFLTDVTVRDNLFASTLLEANIWVGASWGKDPWPIFERLLIRGNSLFDLTAGAGGNSAGISLNFSQKGYVFENYLETAKPVREKESRDLVIFDNIHIPVEN